MSGPNERDEIAAVLAKVARKHVLVGMKHERARNREFHECSCGTRHPVYADGRWPTHAEHVASEESGALTDWLAERDRRTAATAVRAMGAKFRNEARETWGGDVGWTTTGSKVASLAASWCDEEADRIESPDGAAD